MEGWGAMDMRKELKGSNPCGLRIEGTGGYEVFKPSRYIAGPLLVY